MNIKEEILRTEILKNNFKTIKTNINDVIVRGGGIHSNTLSGIPQNITKMLGHYKKTAIVKANKTLDFTGREQDFIIETNLAFTPSLIILVLEGNVFKRKINVISTYNYDYRTPVYEANDNYSRYIKDIKKESFTIATTSRQEDALILLEYIAIE